MKPRGMFKKMSRENESMHKFLYLANPFLRSDGMIEGREIGIKVLPTHYKQKSKPKNETWKFEISNEKFTKT